MSKLNIQIPNIEYCLQYKNGTPGIDRCLQWPANIIISDQQLLMAK